MDILWWRKTKSADTRAPHGAQPDDLMGSITAILYLTRPEHCRGGIALLRHKDGLSSRMRNKKDEEIWKRDMNLPEQREVEHMCAMKSNKICIYDGSQWHRDEPIGGFGYSSANGRPVLATFFE